MGGPRKLTWRDVVEIRRRSAAGEKPSQIVKSYPTYDVNNIRHIIAGRVWNKDPWALVRIGRLRVALTAAQIQAAQAELARAAHELEEISGAAGAAT